MTSSGESISHKLFIVLGSGVTLGVAIAGAYYFHKISQSGGSASVSVGAANGMMILNIIVAIIAGIIFLWTITRMLFKSKSKTEKKVVQGAQGPQGERAANTSAYYTSTELDGGYASNNIGASGINDIIEGQRLFE